MDRHQNGGTEEGMDRQFVLFIFYKIEIKKIPLKKNCKHFLKMPSLLCQTWSDDSVMSVRIVPITDPVCC